ncbi:hypothetical protein ACFX11_012726 [Malus domestica]
MASATPVNRAERAHQMYWEIKKSRMHEGSLESTMSRHPEIPGQGRVLQDTHPEISGRRLPRWQELPDALRRLES